MNRHLYISLLIWLGSILSHSSLGVSHPDPQAKKVVASIRMPASFQADFVYTRIQQDSGQEDSPEKYQIAGKMWVKGNKYRLEWEDQVVVSDGKTIWNYVPSLKEVQIYQEQEGDKKDQISFSPLELLHLHEQGFVPTTYQLLTVDKRQYDQVQLIAKEEGNEIRQLVLVIDRVSHQIKSLQVLEKEPIAHNFALMDMLVRKNLKDSYFQFQMPTEPVEIIDLR